MVSGLISLPCLLLSACVHSFSKHLGVAASVHHNTATQPSGSLLSREHVVFLFSSGTVPYLRLLLDGGTEIISLYPETSTFMFPPLSAPLLPLFSEKTGWPEKPLFLGLHSKCSCVFHLSRAQLSSPSSLRTPVSL